MRLRALVYCSAVLLAAVAAQNSLFQSPADDGAQVANCTSGIPGCVSAGTGPVAASAEHSVLAGACPGGDLHVMHYEPGTTGQPVVATWCK
jgi:hypothetical protein